MLAEGFQVVRVGDAVANHGGSCSKHRTPHGGKEQKGSASVFVNGKPMSREGDTVKCATEQTAPLLRGRPTVLAGDSSPVAASNLISSPDAQAEPGAVRGFQPKTGVQTGPPRLVTLAEIEAFLAPSPTGRTMLQFIKEHNIGSHLGLVEARQHVDRLQVEA